MAIEPERFLRKSRESLVSAQADVRGKRYNSAANRAYYAAFQAAVAALIWQSIRPATGTWQHKFVTSQFSGKLIGRRELFKRELTVILEDLFSIRVIGDYDSADVSKVDADRCVRRAIRFVSEVETAMRHVTLREASAEYLASVNAGNELLDVAATRIEELKSLIKTKYPTAEFGIIRLGPSDYRLNAYIRARSFGRLSNLLAGRTTDILVDDDVWIVVIPRRLSEFKDN